jgi:hypothetical protein
MTPTSKAAVYYRCTSTGMLVCVSTFFVSLPISIAVKPRQPCDAITIKSQFLDVAVSMIAL